MALKKKRDRHVQMIAETLREQYGANHPKARIDVYRYNSASIRVRVIDPDFAGKDLVEREDIVWPIIETLPEEIRSELTVLLLITPKEKKASFMSMEFDNPSASRL